MLTRSAAAAWVVRTTALATTAAVLLALMASPSAGQPIPEDVGEYPDTVRVMRFEQLTQSQAEINAEYDPSEFGRFTDYFTSPDFGVHVALLPTGKVLLFSFERIQDNPQVEPAPTQTIGEENAGRAYLWDPAAGTGPDSFTAVPPPVVNVPDGLDEPRPLPFFCAGHAYLPNGMVGVFGGNLGGNNGAGVPYSLVFDPWSEQWLRQEDMAVGRWYPSVVQGADGRLLIMSGHSELGWQTPTPIVEHFPGSAAEVPYDPTYTEGNPVDRWPDTDAPFQSDYPHLFLLNDGLVYGFGRNASDQFVFNPADETRAQLPPRPGRELRWYGSAVPLPNGTDGPDSVLVMGGDRDDQNTYRFADGEWVTDTPRAFGRTQDTTLILPTGELLTVNGAYDIRDYGYGEFNPNSYLHFRHTELRGTDGTWRLGPVQRLPRGYHSNAVLLPDGRIMVTGDELQQLASNPNIDDPDAYGTIEIYEPPYLFQGTRPELASVPDGPVGYGDTFAVGSPDASEIGQAVLIAPTTSTHAQNPTQRYLELEIAGVGADELTVTAPATAADAPPGHYMLFLLDDDGVPSIAQWVQLRP